MILQNSEKRKKEINRLEIHVSFQSDDILSIELQIVMTELIFSYQLRNNSKKEKKKKIDHISLHFLHEYVL